MPVVLAFDDEYERHVPYVLPFLVVGADDEYSAVETVGSDEHLVSENWFVLSLN
jgi:hypothetical protein